MLEIEPQVHRQLRHDAVLDTRVHVPVFSELPKVDCYQTSVLLIVELREKPLLRALLHGSRWKRALHLPSHAKKVRRKCLQVIRVLQRHLEVDRTQRDDAETLRRVSHFYCVDPLSQILFAGNRIPKLLPSIDEPVLVVTGLQVPVARVHRCVMVAAMPTPSGPTVRQILRRSSMCRAFC